MLRHRGTEVDLQWLQLHRGQSCWGTHLEKYSNFIVFDDINRSVFVI